MFSNDVGKVDNKPLVFLNECLTPTHFVFLRRFECPLHTCCTLNAVNVSVLSSFYRDSCQVV